MYSNLVVDGILVMEVPLRWMEDPWLRGQGRGWVSAPQAQDVYNLCVTNLMLEGLKQCSKRNIFCPVA
ncbi:hypothetical protein A2U01_0081023 [Trifolium medium]|uniref:Uncharacterized protein n=1 Tax=Trifolium medium TaxID=97028 RepID=A0A392TFI8_9FABA|nr:hypothetical protein [Trifolium medium]